MAKYGGEAVRGLKEARAAFKALPAHVRDAAFDATEQTGRVVMSGAKSRLKQGHGYRTGALQRAIGMSRSPKSGFVKVGLQRGAVVVTLPGGRQVRHRPSAIGHLVEFGHGGPHAARAYPFMIPAAEAERTNYAMRMKRAMKTVEGEMAARGGRMV